jgi:tRNA A37 N6-isopentenylltransferase MiaA
MKISISDAIISLRPGVEFVVRGDDLEWLDTEQTRPTDAEIEAEVARLQADYEAKQYQRNRAAEYPSVNDYLDGIVKGDQAQIDAYIAACQAVKTKYPKPE